jgi:antitoxin HigA-1
MESRFKTRKPTHPGRLVREIILPELGITQTEFAKQLGVSRHYIHEFIHERSQLTPDLATKLSCLVGRSPRAWLKMQLASDMWEVEHNPIKFKGKVYSG